LGISTGEFYVADDINRKLTELNSRREFDSVSHELVQKGDEYGVKIKTKGKNWGPHFLRFGLSLSSGFDGAGGYRLQVGHRRPWLTEGGLEWRNDAEFGNAEVTQRTAPAFILSAKACISHRSRSFLILR
jgi:NTE family protein